MKFDDDDFATYYPGRYIRKTDKKGKFYYRDRETGKSVSKKVWETERKAILSAVEVRKKEKESGEKPKTKVPVWISPEKRKKKEIKEKKKIRSKKWEEERRKQVEEIRKARKELERIEKEYRKEQEEIRKKVPPGGGIGGGPGPGPGPGIGPGPGSIIDVEYEDIEYFDVDEVSYSTE